jgi:hypothetical protein
MEYRSTVEASRLLAVHPGRLGRAVWDGRLEAPVKGPGGAFFWTERNIRQACWVLLHRDLDDVLAERTTSTCGRGEGGL